jgi:hypothetical protein
MAKDTSLAPDFLGKAALEDFAKGKRKFGAGKVGSRAMAKGLKAAKRPITLSKRALGSIRG